MSNTREEVIEVQHALVYSLATAPEIVIAVMAVNMHGHVMVWRDIPVQERSSDEAVAHPAEGI